MASCVAHVATICCGQITQSAPGDSLEVSEEAEEGFGFPVAYCSSPHEKRRGEFQEFPQYGCGRKCADQIAGNSQPIMSGENESEASAERPDRGKSILLWKCN